MNRGRTVNKTSAKQSREPDAPARQGTPATSTGVRSAPPPLPDLVQRCADGELTAAQRRNLLARLTADPAGYEPLALALLERQALAAAAREYLRPAAPSTPTPAPSPRRRSAAGMAATATLGLLAGFWLPRPAPTEPAIPIAGRVELAPAEPAAAAPADLPAPVPVAMLEWPTAGGAPLSLPVYDGRDVPPGFGDPLPPGVREELIAGGRYGGELRQEYTFPLADGRLLSVPVHAVSVRGPEVF